MGVAVTLDDRVHQLPYLIQADMHGGVGDLAVLPLRFVSCLVCRRGIAAKQFAVVRQLWMEYTVIELRVMAVSGAGYGHVVGNHLTFELRHDASQSFQAEASVIVWKPEVGQHACRFRCDRKWQFFQAIENGLGVILLAQNIFGLDSAAWQSDK